jgi:hypothetical protein
MSKKSFRARKTGGPDYPRLADLEAGTLRRWGLAAVGGLLIGGSACARTRTAGETEVPKTVTSTVVSKPAHEHSLHGQSGSRDGGAADGRAPGPLNPPPPGVPPVQRVERGAHDLPPPGEPPLQRVENQGGNRAEAGEKPKGQKAGKTNVKPQTVRPPVDRAVMAGKMRMPRVDDNKADDK